MQNTIFKHNLLTCTDKYTSATRDPLPMSLLIGIFQRISEMACLPVASIVFRLEQVQTNFVIRVRLTVRHLLEVLFYPFSSFAWIYLTGSTVNSNS